MNLIKQYEMMSSTRNPKVVSCSILGACAARNWMHVMGQKPSACRDESIASCTLY